MIYDDYMEYMKSLNLDPGRSINPKICRQLVPLLIKYNPKMILEIGRDKGNSMGMFRYFLPESYVVSIDIVRCGEAVFVSEMFGSCKLIDGCSDILKDMDEKFDLILIDGDHTYEGCKKDWINIQNSMSDDCVVLFDNLSHGKGCGQAFYEITDDKYNKTILSCDNRERMGILTTNEK